MGRQKNRPPQVVVKTSNTIEHPCLLAADSTHLVVEEEGEPRVDEVARQLRPAPRQRRVRGRRLPRRQQLLAG